MKIAFIGDGDCTLQNMILFGIAQSKFCDEKVLLLDLTFRDTRLEDAFRQEKQLFVKEESYFEEGMDYLLYRCRQGLLNTKIVNEGITVLGEKLAFVKNALRGRSTDYDANIKNTIDLLLKEFEKKYSLILVKCDEKFLEENNSQFDACIRNICHDNLYRDYVWEKCCNLENNMYTIVGQVSGDCEAEKIFINRNYRIMYENFGLIPYNLRAEMKFESGKILDLFYTQLGSKCDFDYICSIKKIIFSFKKWFEKN